MTLGEVRVSQITPSPVVITVGFIGYIVVVFLTPLYERFAGNREVDAFVQGGTSA